MRKSRVYTDEELELLYNISLTSEEIGVILKIHPITVGRTRKKLGIKGNGDLAELIINVENPKMPKPRNNGCHYFF